MENQKVITAITESKRLRRGKSDIFLDGIFAFSLDNEIIIKQSLKVGRAISQRDILDMNSEDTYQECLNAALHFLSYRPRSESEISQRLQRHGYDVNNITKVLTHLKSLNLVNDAAFAQYWKDNRSTFRPRSQRMVKMELQRKGLESEVIDEAVQDIDDEENAYRTAISRAQKLPAADFQVFRQKMGSYLQRRGFSYGVTNKIVKQVWQEKTHEINSDSDSDFQATTGSSKNNKF